MGRPFRLKPKSVDKTIQNFLQEKRFEQQRQKHFRQIDVAKNAVLKDIGTEVEGLRFQLAMYNHGMTRLNDYYKQDKKGNDVGTIWFPLERTHTDWEPRPCVIGPAASNPARCSHFPCRPNTSYHFMFRELPRWVLDDAEESVRRSKIRTSDRSHDHRTLHLANTPCEVNRNHSSPNSFAGKPFASKPWLQKNDIQLPKLDFPIGMTEREKKLKIAIERKRLRNEMENRPEDRCVNYGRPMSVRLLQQPVRPVVKTLYVR